MSDLDRERRLDRQLAALARADAGATAPPQLEARLRAALQRSRPRARPWLLASAAAAAAMLGLLLLPRPAPPAQRPPAAIWGPRGQRFLPIGAAVAPALERGAIVRLEVPPELALSFGWPLPADDERPRAAEVLVGEDGMARAIRFLPASFRTGTSQGETP